MNWLSLKGTISTNTCIVTWGGSNLSQILNSTEVICNDLWVTSLLISVCSALETEHIRALEYPNGRTLCEVHIGRYPECDRMLTVQPGHDATACSAALNGVHYYLLSRKCQHVPTHPLTGNSTNNKSPSLQQETSECWCAEITVYQRQLPSVHHASIVILAPMHNGTNGAPLKPGLRALLK